MSLIALDPRLSAPVSSKADPQFPLPHGVGTIYGADEFSAPDSEIIVLALAGQTLAQVANQYGVTADQILSWNPNLNIPMATAPEAYTFPTDCVLKIIPIEDRMAAAGVTSETRDGVMGRVYTAKAGQELGEIYAVAQTIDPTLDWGSFVALNMNNLPEHLRTGPAEQVTKWLTVDGGLFQVSVPEVTLADTAIVFKQPDYAQKVAIFFEELYAVTGEQMPGVIRQNLDNPEKLIAMIGLGALIHLLAKSGGALGKAVKWLGAGLLAFDTGRVAWIFNEIGTLKTEEQIRGLARDLSRNGVYSAHMLVDFMALAAGAGLSGLASGPKTAPATVRDYANHGGEFESPYPNYFEEPPLPATGTTPPADITPPPGFSTSGTATGIAEGDASLASADPTPPPYYHDPRRVRPFPEDKNPIANNPAFARPAAQSNGLSTAIDNMATRMGKVHATADDIYTHRHSNLVTYKPEYITTVREAAKADAPILRTADDVTSFIQQFYNRIAQMGPEVYSAFCNDPHSIGGRMPFAMIRNGGLKNMKVVSSSELSNGTSYQITGEVTDPVSGLTRDIIFEVTVAPDGTLANTPRLYDLHNYPSSYPAGQTVPARANRWDFSAGTATSYTADDLNAWLPGTQWGN